MLGLYAVAHPAGSILERHPAYKAAESVRPVGICHERAQHRAAEELSIRSDLWRDGAFTQPTLEGPGEVRIMEAEAASQRRVFREKALGPTPHDAHCTQSCCGSPS